MALRSKNIATLEKIIYFPSNISFLRKNKNKTLKELGNILNISDTGINRWEKGERFPDIIILGKTAQYFDVSLDDLVFTDLRIEGIKENENDIIDIFKENDCMDLSEQEKEDLNNYVSFMKSKRLKK